MKLSERIKMMLDGMPSGAAITIPVDTLLGWINESGPGDFDPDLTVKEVAEMYGRAPSTVTEWIRAGELRAYTMNGREYRIPPSALEEFRRKQRQ